MNNHYIQAAWAGKHFSVPKKKKDRDNAIFVLNLVKIFKSNIQDWPSIEVLFDKKNFYQTTPNNIFLSNNFLLDMSDYFASKIEKEIFFISNIERKLSIDDFDKEFLNKFIALHLSRTEYEVDNVFQYIVSKRHKNIKVLKEEVVKIKEDFNKKNMLKLITNYHIKNQLNDFRNRLEEFNQTRVFIIKLSGLEYNFLCETPFIISDNLDENTKLDILQIFFETIAVDSSLQLEILMNCNPSLEWSMKELALNFIPELSKTISNFCCGFLSSKTSIYMTTENGKMSHVFLKWFINHWVGFRALQMQNNKNFVFHSEASLNFNYDLFKTIPYQHFKEKIISKHNFYNQKNDCI